MTTSTQTTPTPAEIGPYLVTAMAALGAAMVLAWTGDDAFERLFVPVPPVLLVVASTGAGGVWPVVAVVGSLEAMFQVVAAVADTEAGLVVFVF